MHVYVAALIGCAFVQALLNITFKGLFYTYVEFYHLLHFCHYNIPVSAIPFLMFVWLFIKSYKTITVGYFYFKMADDINFFPFQNHPKVTLLILHENKNKSTVYQKKL